MQKRITIRQAAITLGVSPQTVYKHLEALSITPERDQLTGWRMLSQNQLRQLAARNRKPGPKGEK